MSSALWTFLSLVAYIGGLVILLKTNPLLIARSFDEGLFMAIAALDIMGAILAFGGVVIPLIIFNANIAIKVVDFLLLLGILVLTGRLSLFSFRPRFIGSTVRLSRIIVGCYCLFLAAAAAYYMLQLFTA